MYQNTTVWQHRDPSEIKHTAGIAHQEEIASNWSNQGIFQKRGSTLETENRMVAASGWGRGKEGLMGTVSISKDEKSFGNRLNNNIDVVTTTDCVLTLKNW